MLTLQQAGMDYDGYINFKIAEDKTGKLQAIVDSVPTEKQMEAIATVASGDDMLKLELGAEYDVTPAIWVRLLQLLPMYDADENGSYKQSEITEAINVMAGLNDQQRAALWQMQSPTGKNNPFDRNVGNEIKTAYRARKS